MIRTKNWPSEVLFNRVGVLMFNAWQIQRKAVMGRHIVGSDGDVRR